MSFPAFTPPRSTPRSSSRFLRIFAGISGLFAAVAGAETPQSAPAAPSTTAGGVKIGFNQDIRPILSENCFSCHGFDAKRRKAKLRLDVPEGATQPDEDGVLPIKPGDLTKSEVWQRINSADPDEVMPPPDAHKKLTAAQRETLKRWIVEGAPYQKHWAFEMPVKVAPPALANTGWAKNWIDQFVGERLQQVHLAPSPEADRETLLRRVSFDLTGLPPTLQEVEKFKQDASPNAYEKIVDRLLASPRYGEQMARSWLDLARYGDTHGLHFDNERSIWPYRDWVIAAFNRNQPFDQFSIEQIAGDLLPNPTREQLVATGFNRCNVTSSEGGSIAAELLYRYAMDRTTTTMNTWLALTGQCAVCHDHKFDPITQKDTYQFYAFFNNTADPAMDGNALETAPAIKLSTPEQENTLKDFDTKIAAFKAQATKLIEASTYIDPALVQTVVFDKNDPAKDPARSFLAWAQKTKAKPEKSLPDEVKKLLRAANFKNPKMPETEKLRFYYLREVCAATKPAFAELNKGESALAEARKTLNNSIPASLIMRDNEKLHESFILKRGQYDQPGEKVTPGTPAFLPPMEKTDKPNRLTLARWIVSENNPLTARVEVNRLWQQFFGYGLVKSSADFGSQGDPPSHLELLDDLAISFRESHWDIKALVRQIVTSATYRQSSRITPQLYQRDPENRLLARGPRVRLDAEQVRDNALFVSGLLVEKMGGKGVNTYQPPNIWEPVGFVGSNTREYKQDHGEALYRRSIYTFIKRNAPQPFLTTFDAPSREQTCTRRERSDTPLQALQLMNDVQQFEAARNLAQRTLLEAGADPEGRLAWIFRTVLARAPNPREIGIAKEELQAHLEKFRAHPEAAALVLKNGESKTAPNLNPSELAAYTLVASLVLNLDETVTKN